MLTETANGHTRRSFQRPSWRPSFWPRVREFAVPPAMIETATARRRAGDWAGACAAAGVDVDLNPRALTATHGRELAARVLDDLRHLAPDLLRWHLPRIAPDGLLRPGLTVALARYDTGARDGAPHAVRLVARTPPAWADAGQRISLALWDGSRPGAGAFGHRDPHPHPSRRFRFDLHRHLWDVRRADELRVRSGADRPRVDGAPDEGAPAEGLLARGSLAADPDLLRAVPRGLPCAVDRWAAEAEILLRAEGRTDGLFAVRFGARRRLVLRLAGAGAVVVEGVAGVERADGRAGRRADGRVDGRAGGDAGGRAVDAAALPVLPDAATWVLPDLGLLRTGAYDVDRLHPLVAAALVPDRPPATVPPRTPDRAGEPRVVECRGARHRIGFVDGALAPLDHDPAEVRREELLVALGGPPLPCLRAIDEAHRRPDCLTGVRERLDHGDTAGALAVVEGLLGPDAVLRDGPLRDELAVAAERRITYGLFRAGLLWAGARPVPGAGPSGRGGGRSGGTRPRPRPRTRGRNSRAHTRHSTAY
ncbi:hypothetical protein [Streptomyces flavofungini]|uniref:Uncharacterized protein n=1 Tax=Streptomyces flavofungini TaxID=68200 RepID=A0ABS0WXU2_9ACTN|nr:hypothetical protein [Streptomyces flavofungini]MBJ3805755.1 hypothetical protein [Streptomyces flavofungini]GHC71940.1 hypothetical protein GCM10010349_48550 [Streptomyces flavofungini]